MAEWSVAIEARDHGSFGESDAESIVDALAPYAPVVSYGHGSVTARLTIVGDSVQSAIDKALSLFGDVASGYGIYRVEADLAEDMEQELDLVALA